MSVPDIKFNVFPISELGETKLKYRVGCAYWNILVEDADTAKEVARCLEMAYGLGKQAKLEEIREVLRYD